MKDARHPNWLRATATVAISLFLAGACSYESRAEVAPPNLIDLFVGAAFVGIVREENVYPLRAPLWPFVTLGHALADRYPRFPLFWQKTAVARVLEVWKGRRYSKVSYRASPTWVCEIATAKPGEIVVVFLDPVFPLALEIASEGYGRLRISQEGPVDAVWVGGVRLPRELTEHRRPTRYSFESYVVLEDLRRWAQGPNSALQRTAGR